MNDIQRAFMLLDIIQGHPGYAVNCYACERPMTDIFGEVPERAAYLIAEHDNREITLFQWRLVDVSKAAGPPMIPEPVKPSPMMSERPLADYLTSES